MNVPEKFLHIVWNSLLFSLNELQTVDNKEVRIVRKGNANFGSGPDFLMAELIINGTRWFGDIEIETDASHWYDHKHHTDERFETVILLVCWEYDGKPILNRKNTPIPVCVLKPFVSPDLTEKVTVIHQTELPCKGFVKLLPLFLQKKILTDMVFERLELKIHQAKQNDMEQISWQLLWRAFGVPYHHEFFVEISTGLNPATFFTHIADKTTLEALCFGVAGMLEQGFEDEYPNALREQWLYFQKFYGLQSIPMKNYNFKTRVQSYPNLLIAQLVGWLHRWGSQLLSAEENYFSDMGEISDYWKTHHFFDQPTKAPTQIGKDKILKIRLNWQYPVLWYRARYFNKDEYFQKILSELEDLPKESHSLIKKMEKLGWVVENGLESQGITHLYKEYCLTKRCLECQVMQFVLTQKHAKIIFCDE